MAWCWHVTRNLSKGEALKPKVKVQKYLNWETWLSKEVYGVLGAEPRAAEYSEGLGASPPAAGQFLVMFWKKKLF